MVQRLEQRVTTGLSLTPQLQEAIRLLQLSNIEIADYIHQELIQNPFLKMEDTSPFPDDGLDMYAHHRGSQQTSDTHHSKDVLESIAGPLPSLYDHLINQINMDITNPGDRDLAIRLTGMLDESGFIPYDNDTLVTMLHVAPDQLENVLNKLKSMDPPGIFSQNLPECFVTQLKDREKWDPDMASLIDNLNFLVSGDTKKLLHQAGLSTEKLNSLMQELRNLTPYPAKGYDEGDQTYIIPDVVVTSDGKGEWHVTLNSRYMPAISVDKDYYRDIKGHSMTDHESAFITDRYNQASWLIKALEQRKQTMLKVSQYIVDHQKDFLTHGPTFLQPLRLKDVAEDIGMHESTISRVTTGKYMQTVRGTYELKYFFSKSIGGVITNYAAEAIRTRIGQMIEREDPASPLKDDDIVDVLTQQGIQIARRTVAKYRDALGIPSAPRRRRLKAFHL